MTAWGAPCDGSQHVKVRLFGQTETWHRLGVEAVKFAELLALRTQYGRMLVKRQDPYDFQTYACRPIRGSSSGYSLHSWPRATDIRPPANPLRDDGVLITDFDRFGFDDGLEFVSAWLRAGFRWGGTWSHSITDAAKALRNNGKKVRDGRIDTMHFELDGEPVSKGWVERLREYAGEHPNYVQRVLDDAEVGDLKALVAAWRSGKA